MMTATFKGRLQTKLVTYVIVALVAGIFIVWQGPVFLAAAGIAMVVGLLLEALWGAVVIYQPGWMTILFGVIEFEVLLLVGALISLPLSFGQALAFYVAMWIPIQLFLLYLLPVLFPRWGDNGAELF